LGGALELETTYELKLVEFKNYIILLEDLDYLLSYAT
jgi:hypothetical protein